MAVVPRGDVEEIKQLGLRGKRKLRCMLRGPRLSVFDVAIGKYGILRNKEDRCCASVIYSAFRPCICLARLSRLHVLLANYKGLVTRDQMHIGKELPRGFMTRGYASQHQTCQRVASQTLLGIPSREKTCDCGSLQISIASVT